MISFVTVLLDGFAFAPITIILFALVISTAALEPIATQSVKFIVPLRFPLPALYPANVLNSPEVNICPLSFPIATFPVPALLYNAFAPTAVVKSQALVALRPA